MMGELSRQVADMEMEAARLFAEAEEAKAKAMALIEEAKAKAIQAQVERSKASTASSQASLMTGTQSIASSDPLFEEAADEAADATVLAFMETENVPYSISPEDQAILRAAKTSKDVPSRVRNRLYAAISRMVAKNNTNHRIITAWDACGEKGHTGKFSFLKMFAEDPSCAQCLCTQVFEKLTQDYAEKQWAWLTKFQVFAEFHAYSSPRAMHYCEELLAASKKRRNKNKRLKQGDHFDQYRIQLKDIEGAVTQNTEKTSLSVTAQPGQASEKELNNIVGTLKRKQQLEDEENDTPNKRSKKQTPTTAGSETENSFSAEASKLEEGIRKSRVARQKLLESSVRHSEQLAEALQQQGTTCKRLYDKFLEAKFDGHHNPDTVLAEADGLLKTLLEDVEEAENRIARTK